MGSQQGRLRQVYVTAILDNGDPTSGEKSGGEIRVDDVKYSWVAMTAIAAGYSPFQTNPTAWGTKIAKKMGDEAKAEEEKQTAKGKGDGRLGMSKGGSTSGGSEPFKNDSEFPECVVRSNTLARDVLYHDCIYRYRQNLACI